MQGGDAEVATTPAEMGAEEVTTVVDGRRLHYLTAGDPGDPPLVLLHGGIIDAAHISWGELIGPLSEGARVIAPDLPGYGKSALPEGPFGVPDHVDAVASLLADLDLADPVVAGISMGGGVAVGLGLEAPERVGRLVAVAPFALGGGLPNGALSWLLAKVQVTNHVSVALMRRSRGFLAASVENLCYEGNPVNAAAMARIAAEVERPDAGAAFRRLRAAEVTRGGYRTDYSPRLGDMSVPVRLVHGQADEVIPADVSERAHERALNSELFTLEECGHLVTLERPDRTYELVSEVL